MPFLNDLMPCAKSPINSEIFPRPPNSSRNRTTTTIQCQILNEPIGFSSASTEPQSKPDPPICSLHEPPGTVPRPDAGPAFTLNVKVGPGSRKDKDFTRIWVNTVDVNCSQQGLGKPRIRAAFGRIGREPRTYRRPRQSAGVPSSSSVLRGRFRTWRQTEVEIVRLKRILIVT